QKLKIIADAAELLGPTLSPIALKPAPQDGDTVAALGEAARAFARAGAAPGEAGRAAQRLSGALARLSAARAQTRLNAGALLLPGLERLLGKLRASLTATPVSIDDLPADLLRDWRTVDGRARLEVMARGDLNDNAGLRRFATAVLAVAPEATGAPILIQESAGTIVSAFAQAGILALVSITLILFVVLRRASDILYTLLPLLLAGVVTLEL